jgi:hypothetical protein
MSLIDQQVQLQNLAPLLRFASIKGFIMHHFISMAMEVHGAPMHDMDHFIRERAHLFDNRRSRGNLSLSFCI